MADDKSSRELGASDHGSTNGNGSHHHSRFKAPLQRLLHPNGRIVHVANTPEAAESLRKRLTREQGDGGFDLFIRGSKEHIEAIHDIKRHHEERRARLKQQHGGVYDEFEAVHGELDKLSDELNSLAGQGQSVSLDASFNKFGYSAHIRTREDDGEVSRATSFSRSSSEEDRRKGEALRFWKLPTVRQYWHKGLIWRASTSESVEAFELFFDLLYVAIIAIIGDRASEEASSESLLRFCVTFILSWKLWSDLTMVISWFESDDIFQRICVLIFMASLVGFTTNIENAFGSTYTELIAFYLAQRFFEALYFLFVAGLVPLIRGMLIGSAILIMIGSALWIGSIHVEDPSRLALIWLGLVWDLFSTGFIMPLVLHGEKVLVGRLAPLAKYLQFYPALNIEHKTERTNAFVTLVFGYSVVALIYQSSAPAGVNAYYGKAVLGLIIAFAFNMLYFEIDGTNLYVHAIRRHRYAYMAWQYIHLPFILAYVLSSSALAKLVVAHDCRDAAVETLAEDWQGRSEGEISSGLRWFFCAGLGVALACMGIISLTHEHKTLEGLKMEKKYRLSVRFAVSIILICLPLAEGLDSLELVATVTGLVLAVLIVDLWGNTCPKDSFWWDNRGCRYAAECRLGKKDLEAMQKGEVGNLEDLVKRQRREKGGLDLA